MCVWCVYIQYVDFFFFNLSGQISRQPEVILESGPSGYYHQGVWQALGGSTVWQFNTSSAITQCLRGKVIKMYGDSTIRQWFEYFNGALSGR